MSLSLISVLEIRDEKGKWHTMSAYSTSKECNKYYSTRRHPNLFKIIWLNIRSYFRFRKSIPSFTFGGAIESAIRGYKEELDYYKFPNRKQYKFRGDLLTILHLFDLPGEYSLKHNYLNPSGDNFIGNSGYPIDCDKFTKKILSHYGNYDVSYVTLDKISSAEDKARIKLIDNITEYTNHDVIGKIARKVGVKTKKTDDNFMYNPEYFSSKEELYNEMFDEYETLLGLRCAVMCMADNFGGGYNSENVRLISVIC